MPHKPPDLSAIAAYFDPQDQQVYSVSELAELRTTHSDNWTLPIRMSSSQFIDLLQTDRFFSRATGFRPKTRRLSKLFGGKLFNGPRFLTFGFTTFDPLMPQG